MSQVIIINGSGRSGKDTFCSLCAKYHEVSICSSVSEIKRAAMILGWDGQKDERSRKFLSDLKDLATEYSDAPMNYIREYVKAHQNSDELIFLMIREPNEIEKARKEFDAITLLIKRPNIDQISTNHADRDVDHFDYDWTVYNSGTLDDLDEMAQNFVGCIHSDWFQRRRNDTRS